MAALVLAAVQLTSTEDVAANLTRCGALVREAAAAGAELVGLPENFAYLGADRDHRLALAEPLPALAGAADQAPASPPGPGALIGPGGPPGPILTAMRRLAQDARVWLLLGGFPERGAGERIRNTSVLLTPGGDIAALYRKIHLFDVDVPGGLRFRESETVEPGTAPVVAQTPWGGLGLTICYDLRFPELYRGLAAAGARVFAVPSAFTLETGKDHWHVLLRARAIENQAYVWAPAQFGAHGGQRRSYGHALIVDPWGVVLAECGNHEGFALARIDTSYQDEVRRNLPCLTHRRLP